MAIAPTARTAVSMLMPGAGSARRAVPIGISGDAATAAPMAATAPAAAATPTSINPLTISWPRVIPNAASTGLSTELAASRPGLGVLAYNRGVLDLCLHHHRAEGLGCRIGGLEATAVDEDDEGMGSGTGRNA